MRTVRIAAMFSAVLVVASLQSSSAGAAGASPGAPGAPSVWAPAQKSFLGTSRSDASRVYFTGYRGVVSEVFYPVLDSVNSVDLQFLVGDVARTFVDEEKLQSYSSAPALAPPNRTMRWRVVTENIAHHWRITKSVFTDPDRNALVLRTTFNALDGKGVGDFNLYLLHNPAMDNSGANDTSRTLAAGRTMLVASQNARASALVTSLPWKTQSGEIMISNGFVGATDGWTDLLAGAADKTMNWSYGSATGGNVAQMG
ncbi:MAG TPA: amylase, partial [Polyangiaceae bacterium]|nr:amylase [Polyangiaceae bacterium]